MAIFSDISKARLAVAHADLQILFNEVIKYFDCKIICGFRNELDQNKAFEDGYSKLKYPNSKHNQVPSLAVDVVPYPIDWKDVNRMRFFAGFVLGIARQLKVQGKITNEIITGL
jgi:peptidoglycan L-alanyl-D-glutamate endopeptidase CwlK